MWWDSRNETSTRHVVQSEARKAVLETVQKEKACLPGLNGKQPFLFSNSFVGVILLLSLSLLYHSLFSFSVRKRRKT